MPAHRKGSLERYVPPHRGDIATTSPGKSPLNTSSDSKHWEQTSPPNSSKQWPDFKDINVESSDWAEEVENEMENEMEMGMKEMNINNCLKETEEQISPRVGSQSFNRGEWSGRRRDDGIRRNDEEWYQNLGRGRGRGRGIHQQDDRKPPGSSVKREFTTRVQDRIRRVDKPENDGGRSAQDDQCSLISNQSSQPEGRGNMTDLRERIQRRKQMGLNSSQLDLGSKLQGSGSNGFNSNLSTHQFPSQNFHQHDSRYNDDRLEPRYMEEKTSKFSEDRTSQRFSEDCNNYRNRQNENRIDTERSRQHEYKRESKNQQRRESEKNGRQLARPKKNTENFSPCYDAPEMRILCAAPGREQYTRDISSRDVLIVSDLFGDETDMSIYNHLLTELSESGVPQQQLWQSWHGDSHLIADDKRRWKDASPTFQMVMERIKFYFNMDVKATRLNWYRDDSEWKPFHHDAAAIKPDKAKTQNFTVAVSFGAERDAAFEHAGTKTVISMPQPNGTIYTFGKDVNILWRHGILQVPPERQTQQGRISIIAWGWIPQFDL